MLNYLTIIFVCQLIGELIVVTAGLAMPGPVAGMLLLFIGLMLRGGVAPDLGRVADSLLRHLSLLFVPAGVGVMLHMKLIGAEALPISVSLIVSTLLTIAVTGLVMSRMSRVEKRSKPDGAE
ncbi:MAG: CidA/LrgA family protein [Pseudomonadota bacterium]